MNKDFDEYVQSIKKAMERESATVTNNNPSPSDILIAAREMMKKVKDKNARSNQSNR